MEKTLNKEGEFDYDLKNDIVLFKVREREYSHSLELSNLVIDFDSEDFIVGLQVIGASEVFQIPKNVLRAIKGFRMQAKINKGIIQLNLSFASIVRNEKIEYKPIIFEKIGKDFPDSNMICVAN